MPSALGAGGLEKLEVAVEFRANLIQHASREEWLDRRLTGIGASDAPIILGLSKFKSAFQLYHEKLGLEPVSLAENEAVEWGLSLEEPLSKRFMRDSGRETFAPPAWAIYQHAGIPWLIASIDRWQKYRAPGSSVDAVPEVLPLELKTANYSKASEWANEPPIEYQVQVQHQLAVTGCRMASIAVLIGGQKFLWTDVQRDEAFIDAMMEQELIFWRRLNDRNPPPVDGSEQTAETLKRLFKLETGEIKSLGPDAIEWDEQIQALELEIAALEDQKRLCRNQLLNAIGDASMAQLPNGVTYTYKTQARAEHTVKATSYRVLRRKGGK